MYMHVSSAQAVITVKLKRDWPYLLLKIVFLHCQHFFIAKFSKQVLVFVQAKAFQPKRDIWRERERGTEGEREGERERERERGREREREREREGE